MASTSSASEPVPRYGGAQQEQPLALAPIVLGGGVFGAAYNPPSYLTSGTPAKVIKLALDSGAINSFDSSPFYGASETIIGDALASKEIASKHHRSSYYILTKCGRYGANKWSFDYSPERIRRSVNDSLKAFRTDYLDAVYLHDVEFVADAAGPADQEGFPLAALEAEVAEKYGLDSSSAGRILGDGDRKIVAAFSTLVELKKQGKIRKAGIAGYPLATMLRLARLLRARVAPVDILQTYSVYNLQNTALEGYMPHFRAAGVGQITNASPLNMGLLSAGGAQFWHLAPTSLRDACTASHVELQQEKYGTTTIQSVALGFGLRSYEKFGAFPVVGCSLPEHVEELLGIWNEISSNDSAASSTSSSSSYLRKDRRRELEDLVRDRLRPTGYLDWSWASPPPFTEAERS